MKQAQSVLLLLFFPLTTLSQEGIPPSPFLFVSVGITNQVEARVTDIYGSSPWLLLSGGLAASLSRHTYLLGRIGYTSSKKNVSSSTTPSGVSGTNFWYQVMMDAGPLLNFDVGRGFGFGIQGGVSVMWRDIRIHFADAIASSPRVLAGGFLGLSVERTLGDSKFSLFADGQYHAYLKDNSTINSNATSVMIGIRYYTRSDN